MFIVAWSVRIYAATQGGQFFIVDELRYIGGHHFLSYLSDFDLKGASQYFLSNSVHTFFTLFAAFAEFIRYLFVIAFIDSNLQAYELNSTRIGIEVSSCILSLFSILNVLLLYPIIRCAGGSSLQGIVASLLLLLSTTNFYFSRHLLPYDISITLSLLALLLLLRNKEDAKVSFLTGVLSGVSTLTYFGYWPLALANWTCAILISSNKLKAIIYCSLGGIAPAIFLQILGNVVDVNYLSGVLEFIRATGSNQMGDKGVFLSSIVEFSWLTENLYSILLLFFLILSTCYCKFSDYRKLNFKTIGVTYLIIIFGAFIICTEVIGSFVLYGRTIKQIIPYLCLACSFSLCNLMRSVSTKTSISISLTLALITLCVSFNNHLKVLEIVYPKNFKEKAVLITPDFQEISSFIGVKVQKLEKPNIEKKFSLVNAQYLVPPLIEIKNIPQGKVILEETHPYFAFKPYQFLHYNDIERSLINTHKPTMKLIRHRYEYSKPTH